MDLSQYESYRLQALLTVLNCMLFYKNKQVLLDSYDLPVAAMLIVIYSDHVSGTLYFLN